MVPEAFLQHYKMLLRNKGTLTLDELGEIASGLTDGQLEHGLVNDSDLQAVVLPLSQGAGILGGISILRLYGSFSPQQKQALRTPAGLAFASLTPNQYDQFLDLSSGRWGGLEITAGSIAIKGLEPEAKADRPKLVFEFRAQIAPESQKEP